MKSKRQNVLRKNWNSKKLRMLRKTESKVTRKYRFEVFFAYVQKLTLRLRTEHFLTQSNIHTSISLVILKMCRNWSFQCFSQYWTVSNFASRTERYFFALSFLYLGSYCVRCLIELFLMSYNVLLFFFFLSYIFYRYSCFFRTKRIDFDTIVPFVFAIARVAPFFSQCTNTASKKCFTTLISNTSQNFWRLKDREWEIVKALTYTRAKNCEQCDIDGSRKLR